MGIDPITHEPIDSDQTTKNQSIIQQEKQASIETKSKSEQEENKNIGTTTTTIMSQFQTNLGRQENQNIGTMPLTTTTIMPQFQINLDQQENENIGISPKNINSIEVNNNGFCTTEIPVISPNEILILDQSTTPSTSSISSQSSNMILEDLQFLPSFDNWQCDFNMEISWKDDDFSSTLDYLLNDDDISDINNNNNNISQEWSQVLKV